MARIRSIHPGQPTDEAFVSCGPWARLLALLIRNQADDQGVFEWKPVMLKMRIFPADNVEVEPLLEELVATNQVRKYEFAGRQYGAIRNFGTYQSPKSPKATHPITQAMAEYTGVIGRDFVTISEIDAAHPDAIPNDFRNSSAEGVGVGEEESVATAPDSDSGTISPKPNSRLPNGWQADFETFWQAYPSRGRANNPKKPARERYSRLIRDGTEAAVIIAGAKGYAAAMTADGKAGTEYVQQAKTWLNQAGWEQYQETGPPANGAAMGPLFDEAFQRAQYRAQFPGREDDQATVDRLLELRRSGDLEGAEAEARRYLDQHGDAA